MSVRQRMVPSVDFLGYARETVGVEVAESVLERADRGLGLPGFDHEDVAVGLCQVARDYCTAHP